MGPQLNVAAPFSKRVIPAGKYIIAHFKGAPDETTKCHIATYSNWLPDGGFDPDDFSLMEHYLNDARKHGYVGMEVYIKLKKRCIELALALSTDWMPTQSRGTA